jgi:hypothetical protein
VLGAARWRVQQALRPHLGAGFELAGHTLEFDGHGARAREILEFVEASGCDARRWVALDDDEDLVWEVGGAAAVGADEEDDHFSHFGSAATLARMAPHAVRTDAMTGMTSGDADRCIAVQAYSWRGTRAASSKLVKVPRSTLCILAARIVQARSYAYLYLCVRLGGFNFDVQTTPIGESESAMVDCVRRLIRSEGLRLTI